MANRRLTARHYLYGRVIPSGEVVQWPEGMKPSSNSEETDDPVTFGPGAPTEDDDEAEVQKPKPTPKPMAKKT